VPVVEIFRNHWREVLQMGGLQISGFIAFYLCNVYLVTWLIENTTLNAAKILYINTLALGVSLVADPFFSSLSDRTGRKPLLVIGSVLMAAVTVPMFMLMEGAGAAFVLTGQVVLVVAMCAMAGGSTVSWRKSSHPIYVPPAWPSASTSRRFCSVARCQYWQSG
jgi:MHS family proline/betaine transporter-like MFS transporter